MVDSHASADGAGSAQPSKSPPPKGPKRAGLGVVAIVVLGLSKAKGLLGLLKLASLSKFALSMGSMVLMIWLYASRFGAAFAVGFVVLLLIHELGHGWAIRREGLEAGYPVFIPFFGAMISLRGQPRDAEQEAVIAYGGPVAGTLASVACGAVGVWTDSLFWIALAHTGLFMNLFNMLPIRPLDGGRVAYAFSKRAWLVGAGLLTALFLVTKAPQLLLIALLAFTQRGQPHDEITPARQWAWALRYFGLCFLLGGGLFLTHRALVGGG
jgi:Zn-dependent protease